MARTHGRRKSRKESPTTPETIISLRGRARGRMQIQGVGRCGPRFKKEPRLPRALDEWRRQRMFCASAHQLRPRVPITANAWPAERVPTPAVHTEHQLIR